MSKQNSQHSDAKGDDGQDLPLSSPTKATDDPLLDQEEAKQE